jgi:zinc protease
VKRAPSWSRIAITVAILGLGHSALAPSASALNSSVVSAHELSNGVKVLLWEDDTIPNLAIYTFWKVGSRNEAPGTTGLAHFFEHMMFNGSKNYPPGEFDRTMEAAGGANNAYTSQDVTVYQDWVPASALDITLDLEADRIAHLSVDPELVNSERGVVMSERRRSLEDSNAGLMWEQLNSSAFLAHPYSWPVIGWRSDIENWRQLDVEEFHRSWYAVNNAVMIICGAFDREYLLAQLETKIGSIPAREIPRGVVTVEPDQRGERRAVLHKEASLGSVLMAWHVPETAHEDLRALELVDLILTRGESSRLFRRLVEQEEIALSADGDLGNHFDPGLYEIMVQSRESISGDRVESVVYEELDRLIKDGVSAAELQKARNMLLTSFYRQMAGISGRANALGSYELFHGDWKKVFDVESTYLSLNSEDLQRVAAKYFTKDNRTVITLVPLTEEEGDDNAL